jgi:hypothetical protein
MQKVGAHGKHNPQHALGGIRGIEQVLDKRQLLLDNMDAPRLRIGGKQRPKLLSLIDNQHKPGVRLIRKQ